MLLWKLICIGFCVPCLLQSLLPWGGPAARAERFVLRGKQTNTCAKKELKLSTSNSNSNSKSNSKSNSNSKSKSNSNSNNNSNNNNNSTRKKIDQNPTFFSRGLKADMVTARRLT